MTTDETARLRAVLSAALQWAEAEVPQIMSDLSGEDLEDCEWCGEPEWFAEARAVLGEGAGSHDERMAEHQ